MVNFRSLVSTGSINGLEIDPIFNALLGNPNGVATLDGTGNVPISQLGNAPGVSFPLEAPDGLVSAPSYSFADATGSGLYVDPILGSPNIGFAVDGETSAVFYNDGTPQLLVADGTEGNPGLSFISDSNSGLRWVSINVMALVVGGSDVVLLDASAGDPQLKMPDGNAAVPGYSFSSAPQVGMYLSSLSPEGLGLCAGGGERMRVSTDFIGLHTVNQVTTEAVGITGDVRIDGNLLVNGTITPGGSVTFPLSLPDGTETVPSLTFDSDPTSGWFFSGDPKFAANGIGLLKMSILNPQVLLMQEGSESFPSLGSDNSNTTGIFWSGPNVCMAADGTEVVRFGKSLSVQIYAADGTPTAPIYSFLNQTGSGMTYDSGVVIYQGGEPFIKADPNDGDRRVIVSGTSAFPSLVFFGAESTGFGRLSSNLVAYVSGQDISIWQNQGGGDQGFYTNGYLALNSDPGVAVSEAGTARLRYNSTADEIEASKNGAAYETLGGGGGGAPRVHTRNYPGTAAGDKTLTLDDVTIESTAVKIEAMYQINPQADDTVTFLKLQVDGVDVTTNGETLTAGLGIDETGSNLIGFGLELSIQKVVTGLTPGVHDFSVVQFTASGSTSIQRANIIVTEVNCITEVNDAVEGGA